MVLLIEQIEEALVQVAHLSDRLAASLETLSNSRVKRFLQDSSVSIGATRCLNELKKRRELLQSAQVEIQLLEGHRRSSEQERVVGAGGSSKGAEAEEAERLANALEVLPQLQATRDVLTLSRERHMTSDRRAKLEQALRREVDEWRIRTAINAPAATPTPGAQGPDTTMAIVPSGLEQVEQEIRQLELAVRELEDQHRTQAIRTNRQEQIVSTFLTDIETIHQAMIGVQSDQADRLQELDVAKTQAELKLRADYDAAVSAAAKQVAMVADLVKAEEERIQEVQESLDREYAAERQVHGLAELEDEVAKLRETLKRSRQ